MNGHLSARPRLALACCALLAFACATPAERGEACDDSDDCAEALSCVESPLAAAPRLCMEPCDPEESWLCEGDEVCLELAGTPERGVCYLGGSLPVGASCLDRELDCVAGAVCVVFDDSARAECVKACRLEGDDCADDERCAILIEERGGGFCEPA